MSVWGRVLGRSWGNVWGGTGTGADLSDGGIKNTHVMRESHLKKKKKKELKAVLAEPALKQELTTLLRDAEVKATEARLAKAFELESKQDEEAVLAFIAREDKAVSEIIDKAHELITQALKKAGFH